MKVQVILFMAFVAICTSDKEEMGDLAELLNDPQFSEKLLLALEKRLSSPARPKTQDAAKRPTGDCKFATNDSTIIKTQDSIDNGAHFIAAPHLGKDACIRKCCDDGNCTVAVLKENDLACYLFNCGSPNKCLFSSHPDFSVWSLTGSHSTVPVATRKEQENHANALKNLATTKKPTPAPTQNPAALFGACSEAKDCMGSFTDCIVKMCLCQKGYHEQDGMCREDCGRLEFECVNEGAPLVRPQCIAVYDRCDGISHCKDGSDEMGCEPPSTPAPVVVHQQVVQQQPPIVQHVQPVQPGTWYKQPVVQQPVQQAKPVVQQQPVQLQSVPVQQVQNVPQPPVYGQQNYIQSQPLPIQQQQPVLNRPVQPVPQPVYLQQPVLQQQQPVQPQYINQYGSQQLQQPVQNVVPVRPSVQQPQQVQGIPNQYNQQQTYKNSFQGKVPPNVVQQQQQQQPYMTQGPGGGYSWQRPSQGKNNAMTDENDALNTNTDDDKGQDNRRREEDNAQHGDESKDKTVKNDENPTNIHETSMSSNKEHSIKIEQPEKTEETKNKNKLETNDGEGKHSDEGKDGENEDEHDTENRPQDRLKPNSNGNPGRYRGRFQYPYFNRYPSPDEYNYNFYPSDTQGRGYDYDYGAGGNAVVQYNVVFHILRCSIMPFIL